MPEPSPLAVVDGLVAGYDIDTMVHEYRINGFVVLEGTKTFGRFRVLVRVLFSLTLVISRDLTPPPRDIMCVCRFSRP